MSEKLNELQSAIATVGNWDEAGESKSLRIVLGAARELLKIKEIGKLSENQLRNRMRNIFVEGVQYQKEGSVRGNDHSQKCYDIIDEIVMQLAASDAEIARLTELVKLAKQEISDCDTDSRKLVNSLAQTTQTLINERSQSERLTGSATLMVDPLYYKSGVLCCENCNLKHYDTFRNMRCIGLNGMGDKNIIHFDKELERLPDCPAVFAVPTEKGVSDAE